MYIIWKATHNRSIKGTRIVNSMNLLDLRRQYNRQFCLMTIDGRVKAVMILDGVPFAWFVGYLIPLQDSATRQIIHYWSPFDFSKKSLTVLPETAIYTVIMS